jgi:hypothetical protein
MTSLVLVIVSFNFSRESYALEAGPQIFFIYSIIASSERDALKSEKCSPPF